MAPSGFNTPVALILSFVIVFPQSPTVSCDFLSPLTSPIFENACKEVSCGKGNCRPTQNITVPFECVCEPGWKQPLSVHGFSFLPCVLPNCTINYSCSEASSPATAPKNMTEGSIFDPCNWDICGGGTCKRSSSNSSYSCSCSEGYDNLMNSTSLPCFRECALGGDCKQLGITLFNGSTAPVPAVNANDTTSEARSLQGEKFSWVIVLVIFGSMVALA